MTLINLSQRNRLGYGTLSAVFDIVVLNGLVPHPADCTASRLYALAAASYSKAHQQAQAFLQKASGLGLTDDKVCKNCSHFQQRLNPLTTPDVMGLNWF